MTAELKIVLIGAMAANIDAMKEEGWEPNWDNDMAASQGEAIVEFGARACYGSFSKPNPDRQDNASYLKHILEVEHFSVLRHAVVSFYIKGISRACSHELIRHHVGIDYSQLSQRYVNAEDMDYVVPPAMRGNSLLEELLDKSWQGALYDYTLAVGELDPEGKNRKKAREAARAFLPNCTETKIVVTANLQAYRNFIAQRGGVAADAEIRELAVALAKVLKENCPNAFQDLTLDTLPDGREVAVF